MARSRRTGRYIRRRRLGDRNRDARGRFSSVGWFPPPTTLTEAVLRQHKERTQKAALLMLRGVVLRSPVDTGRFRGNWQVTLTVPARGTWRTTDPGGGVTINKGRNVINKGVTFQTYVVTNNLDYAERLENGYSAQAPYGMVTLTLLDVTSRLDR